MSHPADDPRVQQLLREADEAVVSRADPATLAAIHMHLGMVFHEAVRRNRASQRANRPFNAGASNPVAEAEGTMLPENDEISEPLSWTSEVERDDRSGWTEDADIPIAPLFDRGELDDDTNFPDIDADDDLFTLDAAEGWPDPDAILQLTPDLRALLALPFDLTSPDDLAVEASRVQWATSDLDTRFAALPPPALAAILGLLSARANLLAERLDVAVGPRLAIERLRRWRTNRSLPQVAGLEVDPLPERGSWEADARSWWAVFDSSA